MTRQIKTINLLRLVPVGSNRMIALLLCGFCVLMSGHVDPLMAANVYVLSSTDTDIDASVQATMEDFGHTGLMGVQASEFHSAAVLEGYASLDEGQKVGFVIGQGEKGRRATNVVPA